MRPYLDCEWADPEALHLVSMALIDASETRQFYCEIDPLPERPTEMVSFAGRHHHAGVDAEALRWAFVASLEKTP